LLLRLTAKGRWAEDGWQQWDLVTAKMGRSFATIIKDEEMKELLK
jgi:hypothetical protein